MNKLQAIAKQLLAKNTRLKTIVIKNEKSYKLLAADVTTDLCTSIGRREGIFVKRHDLIWAIIDEAKGTAKAKGKTLAY